MKIEVDDVDEILEQIIKIAPPTQKDDHKFLNLLRKLIEKNVIVNPSSNLQELVERNEQRDFRISSLALLRKDLPVQARSGFVKHIDQVKQQIAVQEGLILEDDKAFPYANHVEDYSKMKEDIAKVRETIPAIQGKLKRAHDVVEDAFSKSSGRYLGPSGYAENFFKSI